jgi:hypothetical protein
LGFENEIFGWETSVHVASGTRTAKAAMARLFAEALERDRIAKIADRTARNGLENSAKHINTALGFDVEPGASKANRLTSGKSTVFTAA